MAILDADKEGFLRSETSLIQTIGRAARNSEGHVLSLIHIDVNILVEGILGLREDDSKEKKKEE